MLALAGAMSVAFGAWGVLAQGCTVNSCQGAYIVLDCEPGHPCQDPRFFDDPPPTEADRTPRPDAFEHALRPAAKGAAPDGSEWQSSGILDAWLPFPAQRGYMLYAELPQDRPPTSVIAYVSVTEKANDDQWVVASGNLAELNAFGWDAKRNAWPVRVHNDTCANYFVRVVVRADIPSPRGPADAGAGDAPDAGDTRDGGDADADTSDASDGGDAD